MCVKEREYGMGEGEEKVAREREREGGIEMCLKEKERERVGDRRECENVRETRG